MRRKVVETGTSEWWEALRARAGERRRATIAGGATEVDADLAVVQFFQPLRDEGGVIGAEAALWQGTSYNSAARHAATSNPERAAWLRREARISLDEAAQSADPWVRDYAFNALMNQLVDEGDGRALRAALDRQKANDPAHADELEHRWDLKVAVQQLPPLTDAERLRVVRAIAVWASRHPEPDNPILYMGRETLTARSMASHLEKQTPTGQSLLRMLTIGRTEMSLDEIVSEFEREFVPQAHVSHLRRYPIAVRARGKAMTFAAVTAEQALESFARQGMKRGDVLSVLKPGAHAMDRAAARDAVLVVPASAGARSYPRSVNRIPIRIVRLERPVEL